MKIWYQLTPADTLFFRGAEPLEAGQLSRVALFPPPVTVLQGAIRTAVLKQHGISFAAYNTGRCSEKVTALIGASGQPAPFRVTAVLLAREGVLYAPCPANWFLEAEGHADNDDAPVGCTILRATSLTNAATALRLHSSAGGNLPMVRALDPQSLAGYWLRLDCLHTPPTAIAANDLLDGAALYDAEPRTGIAINGKRKVIQGRLYSAGHVRLRDGVCLVIALDRDLGLADRGLLSLGGEKRICGYTRIERPSLPVSSAPLYLALAPIELTVDLMPSVFAAAKPVALAGWDLATGFHKPTTTWLSAGTVFNRNINDHCFPLAQ